MRRIALILLSLSLSACAGTRERVAEALPFSGDGPDNLVTLAELAAEPNVYAGRLISVPGDISVEGATACLEDQGVAIAIRLSPEQAEMYRAFNMRPVLASGVFDQNICPANQLCPTLCARSGFARLEELEIE